MTQVTIIAGSTNAVEATVQDGHLLLAPERLADAIGWELKPEGLCRDDTCVPVRDAATTLVIDGALDLAAVAGALGRPVVVDADAGLAAIALDAEARRQALAELQAPPITLDDLDGEPHALAEWRGRKRLLLAFSSW